MGPVTTTASSTPCCINPRTDLLVAPEIQAKLPGLQRRAWMVGAGAGLLLPGAGWALPDAGPVLEPASGMRLERRDESLLFSADLAWELPPAVSDALNKGIPVHFIAEVDLLNERWWWTDKVLLNAQRYLRLSFQPLTRRWRLHTGSTPFDGRGLTVALGTTFETLEAALAAMQRIVRWRIGDAASLPSSGEVQLVLRFRIDLSQFPRPLQIGALGSSGWNLLVTREARVSVESLR